MDDRFRFTTIAHEGRAFLGPYSASSLLEFGTLETTRILDVGCGKGAVLEALGGQGIGIEHNPEFVREARDRSPNAEIWEEDAGTCLGRLPWRPDLVVCLGASQAVGTPAEAIARLAGLLPSGGRLLFGDGYWKQTPPPGYLQFLGAEESEMGGIEQTPALAKGVGLEALTSRASSENEWDDYEGAYHRSVLTWCDTHPDDPDSQPFRERIIRWRAAYLQWGRDTLGFGIHLFRRP